jgi:uncharacterized RDD family membrane protein YckC
MSENDGAAPASDRCWNCGQPLKPGSEQCLFCGVAQRRDQPTQFVVSPDGTPGVDAAAAPVQTWIPTPPPAAPSRRASTRAALGPEFSGTAAGVGPQVAAFTIDVLVVVAVSLVVLLVSGKPVFAVLAVVEMIIGLWVLEARTGATVGNAVLRIRASRDDAPFSPGIGRSLVRRLLTGVGFLAAGVGAWVVVASGAWDKKGQGRGWADNAARTLVVAVPKKERASGFTAPATVSAADVPVVLAAPQVVSTLARQHSVDEDSVSQSQTGAPGNSFTASPGSAAAPVAPAAPAPPVAPASAALPENADGTILLVFDTGQRVQFPTPVAVNLGRNPVSTEPNDMLVTVADPEQTVSKTHLRLEHSRGRTWVTDGGSTNGTDLLDDEGDVTTLAPGNRVLLDEGVRVRIGNRAFTISLILGGEK